MKRILKNTPKTKKYLDSLPKYYLVACWAHWGIREFPFSGKYYRADNGLDIPLVYDYNDHNGMCDQWELVRIDHTTTGTIGGWTQSIWFAKKSAEAFNKDDKYFTQSKDIIDHSESKSICESCQYYYEKTYTADVAPVIHGKWVVEWETNSTTHYCCSVCHEHTVDVWKKMNVYELYPYCHCGAKMDGDVE